MHGAITLDAWLVWARDMGSGGRFLTKTVYKTVYKNSLQKNRQGAAASCLSDRSGCR